MLLIGIYIVFALLTAIAVAWLYRKLSTVRGLQHDLVGRTAGTHTQMNLKAQQGFITLGADSLRRERTRDPKVPWGW